VQTSEKRTKVIDHDVVLRAAWQATPFPFATMQGAVRREVLEELVSSFPEEGFRVDTPSAHHPRVQSTRTLAVATVNEVLYRDDAIPGVWNAFVDELLSRHYTGSLANTSGRDLDQASRVISIWKMPLDGFNGLHGTSEGKIISHLFYMARDWDASWGGVFQLHEDDLDRTIAQTIVPRAGTSVAFHSTPVSWHSVKPVTFSERRSLSVHFFKPSVDLDRFLKRYT
jgi:2OG-Fe(II) oxygenase superfamily